LVSLHNLHIATKDCFFVFVANFKRLQPGSAPACRGWTKSPAARSAALILLRVPVDAPRLATTATRTSRKIRKIMEARRNRVLLRGLHWDPLLAGGSRIHGQHHRHTLFEPNDRLQSL